ncbi:MAG: hypothetical protein U1D06_13435 [Paracoccaceae bacterium]|nr:hypothetical protein [Paracoccaceae bacterium]
MEWKQIESNWAAMARRICADAKCGTQTETATPQHRTGKDNVAKSVMSKQIVATSIEVTKKQNIVSAR